MKRRSSLGVLVSVLVLSGGLARSDEKPAAESLPEGAKVSGLRVFPERIELRSAFAYRQILVTADLESGDAVDVTRLARRESTPDVVELSATGLVRPLRDGKGELVFRLGEHAVSVPVEVAGSDVEPPVSFVRDVMPVLSRMGCNGGTCHGSAKGKNGFKLSLRGHDPLFDHRALIDDLAGRRFNRAAPERSLFLMKLSGAVPHEGGLLAGADERYYRILRSWVADGVELDLDSSRIASIEIFPKKPVLPLPGMKQQMAVIATYDDGSVRDVSAEAFIETSDIDITDAERGGIVTALRRGESAIMARYEGRYAATPLYVMGDRSGFEWREVPEYGAIDTLVYKKLRVVKTLPSEVATDAEFLRRLHLDLTGLPPTVRQVRTFLADDRDSKLKRDEMVDRLIGSAAFVDHWSNKWADLLQVNPKFLGPQGAAALRRWIYGAVASNMPYDSFVREILVASGSTLKNPPAAYYKVLRSPEGVMENTTQLFLGIRFSCNKCHDHPFERWTQSNYWALAAFFARVERKDAPGSPRMPRRSATEGTPPAFEELIGDSDKGEVSSPYGGEAVAPEFPYTHGDAPSAELNRRQKLTGWLVSPGNPYFARSFVNRLWSYFMGVGIIDPVDDIRAGNPPTNPELLERLTRVFVDSGFDIRKMMRDICMSRVYRHSISTNRWNEDDHINFSHALARRLPAETLFDAIHQATGSVTKLPGLRLGSRATEADPTVKLGDSFLDLFGRPPRESACECERSSGMSLGQALNLVNGPTVAEAIRDPNNDIANLVSVVRSPQKIVDELYLSILCRLPTAEERAELVKTFDPHDPANGDSLGPEDVKALASRLAEFEKKQNLVVLQPLEPEFLRATGGARLQRQKDGSILVSGENPETSTYTLVAYTDLRGITGFQLEVLPHDSLKAKGPGRADNGNFVLSEFRVAAASAKDPSKVQAVQLQNATQDFAQKGLTAALAIDGKLDDKKGWALGKQFGRPHQAIFEAKEDVGFEGGTLLTFTLDQRFAGKHTIGRFRLRVATSPRPVRHTTLPKNVVAALTTPADQRTPEQKTAIFRQYMRGDRAMQDKIRVGAAQDLAWALLNSPAFLFNR